MAGNWRLGQAERGQGYAGRGPSRGREASAEHEDSRADARRGYFFSCFSAVSDAANRLDEDVIYGTSP